MAAFNPHQPSANSPWAYDLLYAQEQVRLAIEAPPIITAWETFELVLGNSATPTNERYLWRRVGENIEIKGGALLSGAMTGDLQIEFLFPLGLKRDEDKLAGIGNGTFDRIGVAHAWDSSLSQLHTGAAYIDSAAAEAKVKFQGNATSNWNATVPFTWASPDEFFFSITCPILGWGVTA